MDWERAGRHGRRAIPGPVMSSAPHTPSARAVIPPCAAVGIISKPHIIVQAGSLVYLRIGGNNCLFGIRFFLHRKLYIFDFEETG